MNSLYPFARPLYIMAKPVGSLCNLACDYCYYLEKESIYREQEEMSRFVMSDRTLEEYICQYIAAQTQPYVLFVWHGGEPLMRPISFYQKVLRLQQKYARGRYQIENCIQTNGTLRNEEWCAFLPIITGWWEYPSMARRSSTMHIERTEAVSPPLPR